MQAFDVLGDTVRRRILELLADGERSAGELTAVVRDEFKISQPAVSWQLRVLRESGFVTARPDGNRRMYAIGTEPWGEVDRWLARYSRFWQQRLDALATEVVRGRRARRGSAASAPRLGVQRPRPEGGDGVDDVKGEGRA